MPRLTSDYPEKINLRVTLEQRINFITLAWFLHMEGKYGLSIRWFFNKFWPRFYAELSDEKREEFEALRKVVVEKEEFSSPLLPPPTSST